MGYCPRVLESKPAMTLNIKVKYQASLAMYFLSAFCTQAVLSSEPGKFIDTLLNDWQGVAVHTPVGELPYDLHFEKINKQCIQAIADNKFSQHRWHFCENEDKLSLLFFSNFRGNKEEINFRLVSRTEDVYHFRAPDLNFMDLLLQLNKNAVNIKINHHGMLHVEIQLNR